MDGKFINSRNALSIDVEDYWKILACDWLGVDIEPTETVVRNTKRMLNILEYHNIKATFFVLGEVAKKFPHLVREIQKHGHEIGIHGYKHLVIYTISPKKFFNEVYEAKRLVEDIIGQNVQGHRAPSFSIIPQTQWALEVLSEVGFNYDSSIFPFAGKRYGWLSFSQDICKIELPNGKSIIEVPISTVRIFGISIPACGGGYLRHFPYFYTKWAIGRIQRERPAIIYVHPYDIDSEPGPKEIEISLSHGPIRSKLWHLRRLHNRHTVESKLNRLFSNFKFSPICDVINAKLPH